MGLSRTAIPFFTDDITINATEATLPEHLGRITLRDFADGQRVGLWAIDGEEWYAQRRDGAFISGPEE